MRVYPRRVAEKRLERGSHHDAHGYRRSSQSRADPANQWTRKSSSVGRREMRSNLRYRRQHVSTGLDRTAKRHALRLRERVLQAIAVSLRASQLLQRYSHFKVSSCRSSPCLHALRCSIRCSVRCSIPSRITTYRSESKSIVAINASSVESSSNHHRYKLPSNVFTSSRSKDSCFCPKESHDSITRICPPAGTLNVSACNSGSPLIVSFPHFYSGDESLFQKIEGLTPREEHHDSYVDLHSVGISNWDATRVLTTERLRANSFSGLRERIRFSVWALQWLPE